jgi:hypothetical protein
MEAWLAGPAEARSPKCLYRDPAAGPAEGPAILAGRSWRGIVGGGVSPGLQWIDRRPEVRCGRKFILGTAGRRRRVAVPYAAALLGRSGGAAYLMVTIPSIPASA